MATQPDTTKAQPNQRTDESEEEPKEQQAEEIQEINTENEKLKGQDLGLQITTSETQGWSKGNLSLRKLNEGNDNKKFKWTDDNEEYE